MKSQKKTERNTTPVINKEIQLLVCNEKLRQVYESLIHLLSLNIITKSFGFTLLPSNLFWSYSMLPVEDFHEELFYNDSNSFSSFKKLKEAICRYNESIEELKSLLSSKKNPEQKEYSIKECISLNLALLQIWTICYKINFKCDDNRIAELISTNFLYHTPQNGYTLYLLKIQNLMYRDENSDNNQMEEILYPTTPDHPGTAIIEDTLSIIEFHLQKFSNANSIPFEKDRFKKNLLNWIDLIHFNVSYDRIPIISYLYQQTKGESLHKPNVILSHPHSRNASTWSGLNLDIASPKQLNPWIYAYYKHDK